MVRIEIGLKLFTWLNWFDWLEICLQLKVLWNYKVLNSLLELCIVVRASIWTGWRWLDGFSFSWNSPGRRSLWLWTATTSSTSWDSSVLAAWIWHGTAETAWNSLKPFSVFGSEESVVEDCYTMNSTGWRICQLWQRIHGLELVWIGWKTVAMIGSEGSVVEDSYQVLNWLENMSILAGSDT